FFLASFSAGTPGAEDSISKLSGKHAAVGRRSFIAQLPQRLLGSHERVALAVLGYSDIVWGHSVDSPWTRGQIGVYEQTLRRLLDGKPIGWALEAITLRHTELATQLSAELEDIRYGKNPDTRSLAGLWTATQDARNLIIIGDPAVRLRVAQQAAGR